MIILNVIILPEYVHGAKDIMCKDKTFSLFGAEIQVNNLILKYIQLFKLRCVMNNYVSVTACKLIIFHGTLLDVSLTETFYQKSIYINNLENDCSLAGCGSIIGVSNDI